MAILNQELEGQAYTAYTFLQGFSSYSARQGAFPEGLVVEQDGVFTLNPLLHQPLLASLGIPQECIKALGRTLPPPTQREPFKVDAKSYWTIRLTLSRRPEEVNNAAATLRIGINMSFARIQRILMLLQGPAIGEGEITMISHRAMGTDKSQRDLLEEILGNTPPRSPLKRPLLVPNPLPTSAQGRSAGLTPSCSQLRP